MSLNFGGMNIGGSNSGGSKNPWVGLTTPSSIFSDVQYPFTGDKEYDLSSVLPNDNNVYEVLVSGYCTTTVDTVAAIGLRIATSIVPRVHICFGRNNSGSGLMQGSGNAIVPVGTDRKIILPDSATYSGNATLELCAYRKIG